MPAHVVQNLASGSVHTNGRAIPFTLIVSDGAEIPFVIGYATSTQVDGPHGRTFLQLHELIEKSKGPMITAASIPYNFVVTPETASDIAEMLKIESAWPYRPRSA
jgi:hypothetical protein